MSFRCDFLEERRGGRTHVNVFGVQTVGEGGKDDLAIGSRSGEGDGRDVTDFRFGIAEEWR